MAKNTSNAKFEDTIQCSFFVTKPTDLLEDLCKSINKTISTLSQDYIWHRDEFKVCISVFGDDKKERGSPVHLMSTTCFGDNIEDEWFIVYLVYQITSQYDDIIVQLEDNDGDFLLIEAADFLPSWANPDTTENRVFIYQKKIHIIPPEVVDLNSNLDLQNAISTVVEKADKTIASTKIQEAVLKRINSYPQKIKENHHKALVTLPVDIATVLTLKPSLISPIVTSFCNHDMWDAKCFKNVKLEHCVTIPILFTKYLYAMVLQSSLPKISNLTRSSNKNIKEIDIGCKLACGYEIIMSKTSNHLFASSEYHNFLNRLTKNGYFRENIEGSKHYNELLEKAKEYFSNIECPISSYYCYNINEIKSKDEFKNVRDSLLNGVTMSQEDIDSDDWLNINPDELNTFLNTHYGKKVVESNPASNTEITTHLMHFLKKTSDFEGIEYTKEEEEETNISKIDFDSDQFMSCIENILNIVTGEDNNAEDCENDFSEEDDETADIEENITRELASKLHNVDADNSKDENIIKNLLQSIKEEGISGPSSNILKNVDLGQMELLDSDDD